MRAHDISWPLSGSPESAARYSPLRPASGWNTLVVTLRRTFGLFGSPPWRITLVHATEKPLPSGRIVTSRSRAVVPKYALSSFSATPPPENTPKKAAGAIVRCCCADALPATRTRIATIRLRITAPVAFLRRSLSRPRDRGPQRHQNRLDIAAGLQAEQRAAVVQQVEFDVAAAADQLMLALLRGPRPVHALAHDARIGGEHRAPDGLGEGEVLFPVAAVDIVVEDAAGAARLVAVWQEEILVAPFLELHIRIVG